MCTPPPCIRHQHSQPNLLTHLGHQKSWQGIAGIPPRAVYEAAQKVRRERCSAGAGGVPRVEKVGVGGGGRGSGGDPLTPPSALVWQNRDPAAGAPLRGHPRPTSRALGRCRPSSRALERGRAERAEERSPRGPRWPALRTGQKPARGTARDRGVEGPTRGAGGVRERACRPPEGHPDACAGVGATAPIRVTV